MGKSKKRTEETQNYYNDKQIAQSNAAQPGFSSASLQGTSTWAAGLPITILRTSLSPTTIASDVINHPFWNAGITG